MGLADALPVVAGARRITVLTGAGISTDSGIPDFRGPKGVWTRNPGAERTSSLPHYLADAEVRKQAWRNRLASPAWTAEPNRGHLAIVELWGQGRLRALVTQNIDELHQRAGLPADLVVELHGSMWGWMCWSCGARGPMADVLERLRAGEEDPPCQRCGGIIKSTTISFGQSLDPAALQAGVEAATGCDVLLAVGSSLQVQPAAGLVPLAARSGAAVVVVNAEATPYDGMAAAVVREPISDALPALVAAT